MPSMLVLLVLAQVSASPAGRSCASMTWNSVSRHVVLYGGSSQTCGSPASRDTAVWSWAGTGWTSETPSGGPGPREDALLAFDPAANALLLYGGRDGGRVYEDTWSFAAGRWSRLTDRGGPGALEHAAAAFDSVRGRLVVFGGGSRARPQAPSAETWEWDGRSWSRKAVAGPAARVGHSMTWSREHGILLYGGFAAAGSFRDLWAWNGADWRLLDSSGPAETEGPSLFATPGGLLLIGPSGPTNMFGHWRFRDGRWVAGAGPGPGPRIGHTAAYDRERDVLVFFGGAPPGVTLPSAAVMLLTQTGWRMVP